MKLHSVLVTGARRSIGMEFVKQLVTSQEAPEYVFATDINTDALHDLEAIRLDATTKSALYLMKLDVTKKSDIEEAKKFIGNLVGDKGLTLLINNAGILEIEQFPNVTPENLNAHFAVNSIGPLMLFQTMLPLLKKAAAASDLQGMSFSRAGVLNISTMCASIQRTGEIVLSDLVMPGYKMSKAALNMAMRIAAKRVQEDNILVVNICPGGVQSEMTANIQKTMKNPTKWQLQTPEMSVSNMLASIANMNETNHGTYVSHLGEAYPY